MEGCGRNVITHVIEVCILSFRRTKKMEQSEFLQKPGWKVYDVEHLFGFWHLLSRAPLSCASSNLFMPFSYTKLLVNVFLTVFYSPQTYSNIHFLLVKKMCFVVVPCQGFKVPLLIVVSFGDCFSLLLYCFIFFYFYVSFFLIFSILIFW